MRSPKPNHTNNVRIKSPMEEESLHELQLKEPILDEPNIP